MAWKDVLCKPSSLSAWLADNGFPEDVVQAVSTGALEKACVERVKALRAEARAAPVVLLSLRLPERERADGAGDGRRAHAGPVHDGIPALLSAERLARVHPRLPGAVQRFGRACPELLDRSKRRRRECTNVC